MPSRHVVPYCWAKNKWTQDALMRMNKAIVCPGCHQEITNEDVADCIPLIECVSIIRVVTNKCNNLFKA